MTRIALLAIIAFSALANAAPPPPYAINASASRNTDGNILVKIKIVQNKIANVPTLGLTNVETTLSSSNVLLKDGMRAQFSTGNTLPTTQKTDHINLDSGYQVDVISIKGQDTLVMLSTVIDHGLVTWADTASIKVSR